MMLLTITCLAVFSFVASEDDGRYRPELNVNYRRNSYGDGRFYSPFTRYNNYAKNNGFYTPQKPHQELLAPYAISSSENRRNIEKATVTPRTVTPKSTTVGPIYSQVSETTVLPNAFPVYQRSNINEGQAKIVSQDNDFDVNSYHFSYLTENGISAGERGVVENSVNGGTKIVGFYEYIGADGLKYRVDYTADENGFHPTGTHLPKL
ncbi:larval cuticle protein LCP-30-like [Battus philenor]|uniref:larval cuticle protein LCP-30-like n=1 Tax=Battus philenor TaxID=42288 RepID=UPI0035CE91DE